MGEESISGGFDLRQHGWQFGGLLIGKSVLSEFGLNTFWIGLSSGLF